MDPTARQIWIRSNRISAKAKTLTLNSIFGAPVSKNDGIKSVHALHSKTAF
jgi:hypothetical protein